MEELRGACLVAQSGGPTAVINASIQGVIETALASPVITQVLGGIHGIQGVLNEDICLLDAEDPRELALLRQTPGAALGSCRYKLKTEEEMANILKIFEKYDIRYFFYNGGNDSMDTCDKISKYLQSQGYPCRVIGVPKTIDNDLAHTDHCPGFGTAAKYIAASCMEVWRDASVYNTSSVIVMEIMGRHAGWLTAASALATRAGSGPDLIYLPERPLDIDRFLGDVDNLYRKKGKVMIAVSEGIKDTKGRFLTDNASAADAFGHTQLGGLAANLSRLIKTELKVDKIRGIEPSLLQRCPAHFASGRDVEEAYMAGKAAVEAAIAGETDKMVAFRCERGGGYTCSAQLVDLSTVANSEKMVCAEMINAAGNYVTDAFIDYILPLVQGQPELVYEEGLPRYAHLKFCPVVP